MGGSSRSTTTYRDQAQYASVTERGIAWAVDLVVVILIASAMELIVWPFFHVPPSILVVTAFIGYHVVSEAKWGRTVGKHLLGLTVVNTSGEPISMSSAVVRNLTKLIGASSVVLILAGVVLIADSEYNQRLGDRLGETIVVPD